MTKPLHVITKAVSAFCLPVVASERETAIKYILVTKNEGNVCFVATDCHRIVCFTTTTPWQGFGLKEGCYVPRELCLALAAGRSDLQPADVQFPDYKQVIPLDDFCARSLKHVSFSPRYLMEAGRMASQCFKGEANLRLQIPNDNRSPLRMDASVIGEGTLVMALMPLTN